MTGRQALVLVLVPGLVCDEDLFAPQREGLADLADVVVPDIRAAGSLAEMAGLVLDAAPERFALGGLSLGGYVVLEVLRRAPARVERVALMDTSARPETPEQTARRRALLQVVEDRGFDAALDLLWPSEVAPGPSSAGGCSHRADPARHRHRSSAVAARPQRVAQDELLHLAGARLGQLA